MMQVTRDANASDSSIEQGTRGQRDFTVDIDRVHEFRGNGVIHVADPAVDA